MSGYDPVAIRMRPLLVRLQHETRRGTPLTVAFSALCTTLAVPTDLRARLLRRLLDEGYVTEADGDVRLTAAGTTFVAPTRKGASR